MNAKEASALVAAFNLNEPKRIFKQILDQIAHTARIGHDSCEYSLYSIFTERAMSDLHILGFSVETRIVEPDTDTLTIRW